MTDVALASNEADAAALDAVEQHHAVMVGALQAHVERLVHAVEQGREADADLARDNLVGWCETEMISHAMAEEAALYGGAHTMPEARLLVDGMLAEHQILSGLVEQLRSASGVRAALAGYSLRVVFDLHVAKENDLLLPLVAAAPDLSLAAIVAGLHEMVGGHAEHSPLSGGGQCGCDRSRDAACGCGEVDRSRYAELDARAVPHAIRHATIFGALDAVRPGSGLVLLAPHDPLPMLRQLEKRQPGVFAVEYLERGPEIWRLALLRRNGV